VTAAESASKINKLSVSFTLEAGATGKAFGSVTAKDIHDRVVADLKLEDLPKHAVVLDKAIKESGEHTVPVKLHPDVTANLKIEVKVNAPAVEESTEAALERKSRRRVSTEA
jgi:large subunit ribosomal protein L9